MQHRTAHQRYVKKQKNKQTFLPKLSFIVSQGVIHRRSVSVPNIPGMREVKNTKNRQEVTHEETNEKTSKQEVQE